MTQIALSSLITNSKQVTLPFPGYNRFDVTINFLSRELLVSIRKKATRTSYVGRELKEELSDQLFLQLYTKAAIAGWKGLTFKILNEIAPVDVGVQKPEDELEFSDENALVLMQSSTVFDSFISEACTSLGNFNNSSKK